MIKRLSRILAFFIGIGLSPIFVIQWVITDRCETVYLLNYAVEGEYEK